MTGLSILLLLTPEQQNARVIAGVIWVVGVLFFSAVIIVAIVRWIRRRDPDRGGNGYTPVSPAVVAPPYVPPAETLDADDAWLLGFSAPQAMAWPGVDVRAWDLGLSAPQLGEPGALTPAALTPLVTAQRWPTLAREARDAVARAYSLPERAWAITEFAWLQRLAVAAGVQSADAAREATREIASRLDPDVRDWLSFGDLIEQALAARSTALIVFPRELYKPGAPWAKVSWPNRR